MARRRCLLLQYVEADVPAGGSAVYSQLIGLYQSHGKEPAGHIYHEQALRQAGLVMDDATDVESETASENAPPSRESSTVDFSSLNTGAEGGDQPGAGGWRSRGKKRKSKKREGMDLYALLGLQHERWMASETEIKSAYRRAALEYHPDKQHAAAGNDEEAKQASEDRFKAIQEAYETLIDPGKRREFDSLDSFDDSLPGEAEAATPEGFYQAFGAAFRRNSKWSVRTPVPELGGDDADMSAVDEFYDFWFAFKSWREFPHPDEEDVEAAESREERRWIERYNAKLREKPKREEVRRLRGFVELAHKLDPRIERRREAQRAERERQRAEREAQRLRREEEARQREEEAARQREADAAAAAEAKKQRQAEKKALQKERSRLRKICKGGGTESGAQMPSIGVDVDADEVEALCAKLDFAALSTLCDALTAVDLSDEAKAAALAENLAVVQDGEQQESKRKEQAAKAVAASAAQAAAEETAARQRRLQEWSEDEVRMLRKALDKFPPGTSRRWEVIQAYVRTRTVDEVLDMVKYGLKTGKYTAPPSDGPQIARKRQGNLVIHSEATARVQSFTDVDVNLRGDAAVVLGNGVGLAAPSTSSAVAAGKDNGIGAKSDTQAASKASNGASTSGGGAADAVAWTPAEEVALVKALKDVPKDFSDRWDRVAAAVKTKSKAACARRFKEMKESYKAKKAAPGK